DDHAGQIVWKAPGKKRDAYQTEHNELFAGLRAGKIINNGDYMIRSTMAAILGRMATYTGQKITWEQALASKEDLSPARYEWGPLPTPKVAVPGVTRFVWMTKDEWRKTKQARMPKNPMTKEPAMSFRGRAGYLCRPLVIGSLFIVSSFAIRHSSLRADEPPRAAALFNGKDLSGWVNVNGAPDTWQVRDGMIV